MSRIAVIALNTFKENLRDKILYNLVVFGLLLIGSSVLVGTLSLGEQIKIIKDIGLASINIFGVLIAIFIGIGLVSKELDKRTIYTIIAKPVSRYQFLVGKYVGLMITLFVNLAFMVLGFVLALLVVGVIPDLALWKAIGLIYVELLVITAVAILFSTFTTATLSGTFTLAIYVIGHLTNDLRELGRRLSSSVTNIVLDGIYYSLPNLDYFNIKGQAVHGVAIPSSYILSAVTYGIGYSAMVLALACVIFQRRDFK